MTNLLSLQIAVKSESDKNQESRLKADHIIDYLRFYADNRVNSRLIDERRCVPPYVMQDLAREGLFGMQIEKKYGGQSLTFKDSFRVLAQVAAIDPNITVLVNVHHAIGTPPIKYFASEKMKQEVLPQLATGKALATLAASEPGAGANVKGIRTQARRIANGYRLNGEKCWISLGSWAGYVSVFAQQLNDEGKPRGLSGFLVRQGTTGFYPGREAVTLGMKGIPQNQIAIDNLHVDLDALLGREGEGFAVAQSAFMLGRILVAVNGIGAMKRCLQLATRYAGRRPVATGRLLENGLTLQILSDAIAATKALEYFVNEIAYRLDHNVHLPSEFNFVAKILGGELMWNVIDRCLQMLGARGFMDTNIIGQFFRDYRLLRIFEGPTETMQVYLGTMVMKNDTAFCKILRQSFNRESNAESIIQTFQSAIERAKSQLAKNNPESEAGQQALAAKIGDLACWALLAAVIQNAAQNAVQNAQDKDGDATDSFTEDWCFEKFENAARDLSGESYCHRGLLTPMLILDQVARFTEDIGDTEQTLAGEENRLDQMLMRQQLS